MNKNYKITVAIVLVLVLVLAVVYFWYLGKIPRTVDNNTPSNNFIPPQINNSTNPGSTTGTNKPPTATTPAKNFSIPSPNAPSMIINTSQGDIKTNNLYKDSSKIIPGTGNAVLFSKNDSYHMSFYPQNQGILITIIDPAIQAARDKAESELLADLGITKDQACKLTVDLGVPEWVNSQASGTNYGLSFCPNGKPFPKQ